MKELVEVMVSALVSDTAEVKIESRTDEKGEVITIHVSKDDIGKLIGKGGRIAKAIRSVVKAAASKDNKRVLVSIED